MLKGFFGHLRTVGRHRRLVRKGCFKIGLYMQGLTHDLSKYSPAEFWPGVKYYQGVRSPNVAQRRTLGYSPAWLHHKGRNKHHFEYWTDYNESTDQFAVPVKMPRKYVAEMIMDRIAACKVYKKNEYTDASAYEYLHKRDPESMFHPDTYKELDYALALLKDKGEAALYDYLKNEYLKKPTRQQGE